MLRIIAIAILVYVAMRIILRLFGLGSSRKKQRQTQSKSRHHETHQKGDVIIEYNKPPKKRPRVDADDVDFEEID